MSLMETTFCTWDAFKDAEVGPARMYVFHSDPARRPPRNHARADPFPETTV